MNILFVVPYTPNKIRIRPYNLLRFLASRGNRVTLLTLTSGEVDYESIRELERDGIQVISYPLSIVRSMTNCAYGVFTPDPLQSFYCWQPQLARKLVEILQGQQTGKPFDVVHIEHLRGVRFGQYIRAKLGRSAPPIVWDSVDCISYLFQQAAQNSTKLTSRLMTRFELPRTGVYEAKMAAMFDRTLVTSRLDQEAFAGLDAIGSTAPVTVLPNGVDLEYFSPIPVAEREPATLVISGKMSYHANISMVTYLIDRIMPLIWSKKPEVRLWIVGKDPPPEVCALVEHAGVTVTGFVPDLRPYLQKATVALAPLTYGAGIQNKVLEAMACGLPVVATPRAVAALSVVSGQDLIVEQDPAAFAAKVIGLLDDSTYAQNIGEAGRSYVETHHDWTAIAEKLETIYRDAAASQQ